MQEIIRASSLSYMYVLIFYLDKALGLLTIGYRVFKLLTLFSVISPYVEVLGPPEGRCIGMKTAGKVSNNANASSIVVVQQIEPKWFQCWRAPSFYTF